MTEDIVSPFSKTVLPDAQRNHNPDTTTSHGMGAYKETQTLTSAVQQTFFEAVVIDCLQFLNHYLVMTVNDWDILAAPGERFGASNMDFTEHATYTVGTAVLCYRPVGAQIATILCALPREVNSANTNLPEHVFQFSGVGFQDDKVHHYMLDHDPKGTKVINYGNHKMCDAFPGEYGAFNALGLGIHLGMFSAMIRATDLAGLTFSYLDHHARLSAYNYQLWTAGREEWSYNDEAENNDVVRIAPFPWEAVGVTVPGADFTRAGSAAWEKGNTETYREPTKDDQTGIFRLHQFRGYLGDAERVLVSCPPPDFVAPEALSSTTRHIGLLETVRHANGLYSVRSAKGIHFEKYLFLPVPKEMKRPEDPTGDTATEQQYNPAGQVDGLEPHNKAEFEWGSTDVGARQAQLWDMHAWMYNSYGLVPLDRHIKDWKVWQESDAPAPLAGGAIDPGVYERLGATFAKGLPAALSLQIDARPNHTHTYYRSRSLFAMNDDGSVVIEDGYGSQLIMGGGNVELTCQGDLILRPGRNVTALAPHDVILRAGNCADLTAALGDVRIKAEENFHVLAGNSTTNGGILLESRANSLTNDYLAKYGTDVKSSGLVLLAKNSAALVYAKGVYVRTFDNARIVLDADTGNGNIDMYANSILQTLQDKQVIEFGKRPDDDHDPVATETHSAYEIVFGQPNQILIKARSTIVTDGFVGINGTVLAKQLIQDTGNEHVGANWTADDRTIFNQANIDLTMTDNTARDLQGESKAEIYEPDTGVGNSSFINLLGFTCRTDAQYEVEGLVLYEARWQQQLRLAGDQTTWDEPAVMAPNNTSSTLPYPGYGNWNTSSAYAEVDPELWDNQAMCNSDRLYDEPTGAAPVKKTLATGYLINLQ